MKKSSFITLILGVVSGMLFALGMCMALLPEWNAFKPGIIFGGLGIVFGLITLLVWRKMTGKQPLHLSGKAVATAVIAIVGALALGVGMCFCMVWQQMVLGIVIGIIGIVILLCLIPFVKGLKD